MVLSWKVKVLKSYGCKTQETIFFNLVLKYLLSCFEKPKQPYFLKPHLVFKTQEPLYWLMSLQEAFSYYFQVRISDYPISDQISPHHYPFHYNYPPSFQITPRGVILVQVSNSLDVYSLWFWPFLIFSPDPKINHKEWVPL